jgi:hypothetical protein
VRDVFRLSVQGRYRVSVRWCATRACRVADACEHAERKA